jgi:hypothetical protein
VEQQRPPGQGEQTPPLHCAPVAQLALLVQVVAQAVVPQT